MFDSFFLTTRIIVITLFLSESAIAIASSCPGARTAPDPNNVTACPSATTYYISTNGTDSNDGSSAAPWATFTYATAQLNPCDTLLIRDGIYDQAHQQLKVMASGEPLQPITIQAENDGQVIIDGTNISNWPESPCYVGTDKHDIILNGMRCQNTGATDANTVMIYKADRITLKRVSANNAGSGNAAVYSITSSTDVVLEDCAAYGSGRKMYLAYESHYVTIRRSWGVWQCHPPGSNGGGVFLSLYGTDDSLVENTMGMVDPKQPVVGGCIGSVEDGHPFYPVLGFTSTTNSWNPALSNRNSFYGNIAYNMGLSSFRAIPGENTENIEDTAFHHNVIINDSNNRIDLSGSKGLVMQYGDKNMLMTNFTGIGFDDPKGYGYMQYLLDDNTANTKDSTGILKNSLFRDSSYGIYKRPGQDPASQLVNSYNNYWNIGTVYANAEVSQGTGEITVDPMQDVARYGNGAYLFIPENSPLKTAGENGGQIGAEILYRYENCQLTEQPLWPWPMEERILAETGFSPTYYQQGAYVTVDNVTYERGGLWKTLADVYPASNDTISLGMIFLLLLKD